MPVAFLAFADAAVDLPALPESLRAAPAGKGLAARVPAGPLVLTSADSIAPVDACPAQAGYGAQYRPAPAAVPFLRMAPLRLHSPAPRVIPALAASWFPLRAALGRLARDRANFTRRPALAATVAMMLLFAGSAGPSRDDGRPPDSLLRAEFASVWEHVRQTASRRAAVALVDDFRSGLGDWFGRDRWQESWSYDAAGFVRPGALALYRPSMALADYELRFQGQIEKGGLSWVYRASGPEDFYAAKLKIIHSGPLPRAVLERWAVIGGKKDKPTRMPVPFTVRQDRLYVVQVDVRGADFTTSLDNQVIDFYTDDRLPAGGVGFFSDSGERARLRWVTVRHQFDLLGRLCALVAPYGGIQPTTRLQTP